MRSTRACHESAEVLLAVRELAVHLNRASGTTTLVHDLNFELRRGERLGIVGESGSGKSTAALALADLLPESMRRGGRICINGEDLAANADDQWSRLRGRRLGMVFQEPMSALNPLHPIARQVGEPLVWHGLASARQARTRAIGLLEQVGFAAAARRADSYPHQLSGGERQRAIIAMALACSPDLLIADEPTTALDPTLQREILGILSRRAADEGMALILISHDLAVVTANTDRLMVMYAGFIVEAGPTESVVGRRAHPYTRALFAARPRLGVGRGTRLPTIAGNMPRAGELPPGCPFAGRCPLTIPACEAALPPAAPVTEGHWARCIRLDVAAETT